VVQQEKMLETATVAVPMTDPRYPAQLREIYDPPVMLFARGRVELLQATLFGVVGTRRPTPSVSPRPSAWRAIWHAPVW